MDLAFYQQTLIKITGKEKTVGLVFGLPLGTRVTGNKGHLDLSCPLGCSGSVCLREAGARSPGVWEGDVWKTKWGCRHTTVQSQP